jgi:hypothetical protein
MPAAICMLTAAPFNADESLACHLTWTLYALTPVVPRNTWAMTVEDWTQGSAMLPARVHPSVLYQVNPDCVWQTKVLFHMVSKPIC